MVNGRFADGITSQVIQATLLQQGTWLVVRSADGVVLNRTPQDVATLSTRLGNTPRTVSLQADKGHPTFETSDHAGVESLLPKQKGAVNFLHKLETHLGLIGVATAFTLAAVLWFVAYAVPTGAKVVAMTLPDQLLEQAGDHSIGVLDRIYLNPSELSAVEQARIREVLAPHIPVGPEALHFRSWVPNALALPDGSIVFTDELIELAENDEELIAIAYHELGHVEHRHLIRRSLQDSAVLIGLFLLTGDLGGADFLTGITATLADLAYSIAFEREADDYALDSLAALGISKDHYRSILQRLDAWYSKDSEESDSSPSALQYLSTHPQTANRILAIDAYQPDS
ncbi:MAG: M48 family metalloprotease [Proteobacteria bacterium]|nr:M48 family metalloprotease [Pseudomonadota bacterium]